MNNEQSKESTVVIFNEYHDAITGKVYRSMPRRVKIDELPKIREKMANDVGFFHGFAPSFFRWVASGFKRELRSTVSFDINLADGTVMFVPFQVASRMIIFIKEATGSLLEEWVSTIENANSPSKD
jgi:hypothetical protein